jgi:uncharacterized protein YndB with AHSA1/START domain
MMQRSVAHTSFVIEREFSGTPAQVFHAFTDATALREWADCHSSDDNNEQFSDFRPGGSAMQRMTGEHGTVTVNTRYFDIVPEERIIHAYDILMGETRLSVSLVTIELAPGGNGTRMKFTEQAAFLDGHQEPEERIEGTKEGFERLEHWLSR